MNINPSSVVIRSRIEQGQTSFSAPSGTHAGDDGEVRRNSPPRSPGRVEAPTSRREVDAQASAADRVDELRDKVADAMWHVGAQETAVKRLRGRSLLDRCDFWFARLEPRITPLSGFKASSAKIWSDIVRLATQPRLSTASSVGAGLALAPATFAINLLFLPWLVPLTPLAHLNVDVPWLPGYAQSVQANAELEESRAKLCMLQREYQSLMQLDEPAPTCPSDAVGDARQFMDITPQPLWKTQKRPGLERLT